MKRTGWTGHGNVIDRVVVHRARTGALDYARSNVVTVDGAARRDADIASARVHARVIAVGSAIAGARSHAMAVQ